MPVLNRIRPRLQTNLLCIMEDVEYNDANRAFIQAFMARSSMTLPEVQPVLAAIISLHGTVFQLFKVDSSC